ncbi:MAG: hypothetical protein QME96_18785, partial [Myxococcota bacterium]|nr:hypothetical protein [Myxococcota bacterium]
MSADRIVDVVFARGDPQARHRTLTAAALAAAMYLLLIAAAALSDLGDPERPGPEQPEAVPALHVVERTPPPPPRDQPPEPPRP